jgi:trigger factor
MASELAAIQVQVEKPGAWARRLTITVPAERLERERRTAVQKLAKQVRLPGFRKGKVPERIMQQRFGAAIEQEMLERVMGDAYREALQREGLQPISQGAIARTELNSKPWSVAVYRGFEQGIKIIHVSVATTTATA